MPKRRVTIPIKSFSIQMHVTEKCENNCKFCYMFNEPTHMYMLENELCIQDWRCIVDDFSRCLNMWGIPGGIVITGGNAFLKEGIYDLLKYISKKNIGIEILGNPSKITPEFASYLYSLGVKRYQISIDGLEKTHDYLRYKGAFREALQAILALKNSPIRCDVMITLSNENLPEIVDLLCLLAEVEPDYVDFSRMVPIGKGKNFKGEVISPEVYRKTLIKILEEYLNFKKMGYSINFGRKEPLWNLLYEEIGFDRLLYADSEYIEGGCLIWYPTLCIMPDGTIVACRRCPIPIGKVPEQKIDDIFFKSSTLLKLRNNLANIKKCGKCPLVTLCRGCRGLANASYNDFLAPDPQCWQKSIGGN